jgi:hypothetical protein
LRKCQDQDGIECMIESASSIIGLTENVLAKRDGETCWRNMLTENVLAKRAPPITVLAERAPPSASANKMPPPPPRKRNKLKTQMVESVEVVQLVT